VPLRTLWCAAISHALAFSAFAHVVSFFERLIMLVPLPKHPTSMRPRVMQAHLAAKAHQFGAIVLRHQAESFIAADECGSQIACLQVYLAMRIVA